MLSLSTLAGMRTYRDTRVLVTGASSGLGAEFATRFASRGADVVLVARRVDRLRDLAARLERDHHIQALPLAIDLGEPKADARLRAMLDERGVRVDSLVNNAGFGVKGPFVANDPARVEQMVAVNVGALVALTRQFLPGMAASGAGVLVNVASTGAYQPCPDMALYGATKAFVLSFTEALAYECRGSGLRVLAVSPGPTLTEFFEVAGRGAAAVGRFQTPQQVVDKALRELDRSRPRPSFVSGRSNALTATLAGMMPRRLTLAVAGRLLR